MAAPTGKVAAFDAFAPKAKALEELIAELPEPVKPKVSPPAISASNGVVMRGTPPETANTAP